MPISDYVPPDTPTNNDYLTHIAGGVDPDATLDPRMTNNDLLRIIAEGTGGLAHLELMSPTTIGGAKLGDGLALTDGALGIDSEQLESTGEVRGAVLSLTAKGWATQDGTYGRNLWRQTAYEDGYSLPAPNNGISMTYVHGSSAICTGTATANANVFGSSSTTDTNFFVSLPAGTYTASSNTNYQIKSLVNGAVGTICAARTAPYTFTLSEETLVHIAPFVPSGTTVNEEKIWAQIELGSTATGYEPYTGGAPSPSPEYAQKIQVARGRNLIDVANALVGKGRSTSTGNFENAPTVTCGNQMIPVMAGESLTKQGFTGRPRLFFFRADGTFLNSSLYDNNVDTMTVPSEAAYIDWQVTTTYITDTAQIERGSIPTPYVPYGYVGVNVEMPSKLYKAGHAIAADGTEGANVDYDIYSIGSVSAGTYEITYVSTNTTRRTRIHGYDAAGNWVLQLLDVSSTNNKPAGPKARTVTVPEGVVEIRVNLGDDFSSLAVTKLVPVPLPSKGYAASLPDDTADVLTIDGAGKVEWASATNMVTLDGSESWSVATVNGMAYAYLPAPQDMPSTRVGGYAGLCDAYVVDDTVSALNATVNNTMILCNRTMSSIARVVCIDATNATSAATYTAWLAQNPITVLYSLATPATEQCGYIDWPTIPDGATVTCPELDALGVRYLIGNGVSEMAREWYERGHAEAQATSTALGELAQSVLEVDGKADAVAAQLVVEDVFNGINLNATDVPNANISVSGSLLRVLDIVYLSLRVFTIDEDITVDVNGVTVFTFEGRAMPTGQYTADYVFASLQTNIPGVSAYVMRSGEVRLAGDGYVIEAGTSFADSGITITGTYPLIPSGN